MTNSLSTKGRQRLDRYERTIASGIKTFEAVGNALKGIRDERLYREDFDTFDEYLARRWHFTGQRARQLMQAAEIATVVAVDNEAQARALAPIKDDPDAMREVVQQAEDDGDKSAKNLSKYVKNFKNAGEEASSNGVETSAPIIDTTGRDVDQVTCPVCNGTGTIAADLPLAAS